MKDSKYYRLRANMHQQLAEDASQPDWVRASNKRAALDYRIKAVDAEIVEDEQAMTGLLVLPGDEASREDLDAHLARVMEGVWKLVEARSELVRRINEIA